MTPAHHAKHLPGYDRLHRTTGPTGSILPPTTTDTSHNPNMHTTATNTLADQFRAKVDDYSTKAGLDFDTAWQACKGLYPALWNSWQGASAAANVRAANEAAQASESTAQTKADALAEFNRRVNGRMQGEGTGFGDAWAYVQQTQPRLYARMNGDFATDKTLSEQGHSLPTTKG